MMSSEEQARLSNAVREARPRAAMLPKVDPQGRTPEDETSRFREGFEPQPESGSEPMVETAVASVQPTRRTPQDGSARTAEPITPGIGRPEILVGFLALLAWIFLFTAGIVVSTAHYRDLLQGSREVPTSEAFVSWIVIVLCYTVTNPAFLSCLAALLGSLAYRARSGGDLEDQVQPERTAQILKAESPLKDYLSAVMRGFFLYLVLLSGLLLLTTQALTSATQDQYIRLAGTISVLCFLVGYDPNLFTNIMKRISGIAQGQGRFEGPSGSDRTEARVERDVHMHERRSVSVPAGAAESANARGNSPTGTRDPAGASVGG